jgi:hypothetical protein
VEAERRLFLQSLIPIRSPEHPSCARNPKRGDRGTRRARPRKRRDRSLRIRWPPYPRRLHETYLPHPRLRGGVPDAFSRLCLYRRLCGRASMVVRGDPVDASSQGLVSLRSLQELGPDLRRSHLVGHLSMKLRLFAAAFCRWLLHVQYLPGFSCHCQVYEGDAIQKTHCCWDRCCGAS